MLKIELIHALPAIRVARWRMATVPRKPTTTTTTKTITPISQAVNVELLSRGTEVEEGMLELPVVEVEAEAVVVELPVAWGTGVDSRPPEDKISECRQICSANVPALRAAATLKVLPACLKYIQQTFQDV